MSHAPLAGLATNQDDSEAVSTLHYNFVCVLLAGYGAPPPAMAQGYGAPPGMMQRGPPPPQQQQQRGPSGYGQQRR
jgi:hypothetical protein